MRAEDTGRPFGLAPSQLPAVFVARRWRATGEGRRRQKRGVTQRRKDAKKTRRVPCLLSSLCVLASLRFMTAFSVFQNPRSATEEGREGNAEARRRKNASTDGADCADSKSGSSEICVNHRNQRNDRVRFHVVTAKTAGRDAGRYTSLVPCWADGSFSWRLRLVMRLQRALPALQWHTGDED